MLRTGRARRDILTMLALAGERANVGSVCSILIVDEQGLLRNGASPSLPQDYLLANPCVGTCAAAAATGRVVITRDFSADDKWGELRHLPLALGFRAAWSIPITSSGGRVLGTFGTYLRERRGPSEDELHASEILAGAAGSAMA